MAYFLFRIWLAWVRLSSPQAISAIPSLDIYRKKPKKKELQEFLFPRVLQIMIHKE